MIKIRIKSIYCGTVMVIHTQNEGHTISYTNYCKQWPNILPIWHCTHPVSHCPCVPEFPVQVHAEGFELVDLHVLESNLLILGCTHSLNTHIWGNMWGRDSHIAIMKSNDLNVKTWKTWLSIPSPNWNDTNTLIAQGKGIQWKLK